MIEVPLTDSYDAHFTAPGTTVQKKTNRRSKKCGPGKSFYSCPGAIGYHQPAASFGNKGKGRGRWLAPRSFHQ